MVLLMKSAGELVSNDSDFQAYNEKLNLSCEEIDKIVDIVEEIPEEYMHKQDDCNRVDFAYSSRFVEQLRPSTHPIFLIKEYDVVVKVFHSIEHANNEMQARDILKEQFEIIPAKKICCKQYYLLITPYVKNAIMLSELSKHNFDFFLRCYSDVFNNLVNYIYANKKLVKNNDIIVYAGRSIECMQKWIHETQRMVDGYTVYSHVTNVFFDLSDEIKKSIVALEKKSKFSCVFSGDINCHNIIHTKKGCAYLDFEYWGNMDVEYLFSVLIGSLFNHCEIAENENYSYDALVGKVFYNNKIDFWKMKSISRFLEMELDYERIRGFIIARMYYKFDDLINNWNESRSIIPICMIFDFFEMLKKFRENNDENNIPRKEKICS